MSLMIFENRFISFDVPQINRAVHRCSYKSFLIDRSDSVNGILVAFEYYFSLFLCFPNNGLMIISCSYKIACVKVVNI